MPHGGESNDQSKRNVSDAAAAAAGSAPSATASSEAVDLEAKLAELEAQIAQLKEERLRALAEVENVRRRAARDRQDASQYAITGFARNTLSVAYNLQRALASVDAAARAADPTLDTLMSGIEMTERELLAVLERYGVKPIQAEGLLFDPHVHEAMFEIPNQAVPHGTVLQVLQGGYMLHDRTLRPARVGIARGGPKLTPGAVAPDAAAADAPRPAEVPVTEAPVVEAPVAEAPGTADADGDAAAGARVATSSATGDPTADNIIDFSQRTGGDRYPRPQEGDPRSGSQVDETL